MFVPLKSRSFIWSIFVQFYCHCIIYDLYIYMTWIKTTIIKEQNRQRIEPHSRNIDFQTTTDFELCRVTMSYHMESVMSIVRTVQGCESGLFERCMQLGRIWASFLLSFYSPVVSVSKKTFNPCTVIFVLYICIMQVQVCKLVNQNQDWPVVCFDCVIVLKVVHDMLY